MKELPEGLAQVNNDAMTMLDPDALLADKLVQAVTGYSAQKLRAMALLRLYSPRVFSEMIGLATNYQLNMSSGAARQIRAAIEARAMKGFQEAKQGGGLGKKLGGD